MYERMLYHMREKCISDLNRRKLYMRVLCDNNNALEVIKLN